MRDAGWCCRDIQPLSRLTAGLPYYVFRDERLENLCLCAFLMDSEHRAPIIRPGPPLTSNCEDQTLFSAQRLKMATGPMLKLHYLQWLEIFWTT